MASDDQHRTVRAPVRVAGVARVCLLVFASALLSGSWLLLRARAQLGERAIVLGHSTAEALKDYPGTTPITLNGQRLSLNATSTPLSVGAVLDRFATQCDRSDGGMQHYLDALHTGRAKLPTEAAWSRLTLFRNQSEKEGTAACLARETSAAPFSDLVARISASLEQEDLSRLGQFRYVFARKSKTTGLTQVLSVWSRGPLKPFALMADGRDAAGRDLVLGVRPANSLRVVSIQADNHGFEAALYESPQSAEQSLTGYDTALRARGYVALAAPQLDAVAPVPVRAYTFGGGDPLLAVAVPTARGSLLSAFRIAANGDASNFARRR